MASTRSGNKALWILAMFLLCFSLISVTALYLDLRKQHAKLKAENLRLAESQVLLMVPESQAAALAQWLDSHPEQTGHLVDRARSQKGAQSTKGADVPNSALSMGDDAKSSHVAAKDEAPHAANTATETEAAHQASSPAEAGKVPALGLPDALLPVVVSESGNGVKVIALPNGGIRVTTRDENQ